MPDSLDDPKPAVVAAAATTKTSAHPPRARSAVRAGLVVFVLSVLLALLPLAIPLGGLAKYLVAPAFVGACIGLGIAANAAIDSLRGRRK